MINKNHRSIQTTTRNTPVEKLEARLVETKLGIYELAATTACCCYCLLLLLLATAAIQSCKQLAWGVE